MSEPEAKFDPARITLTPEETEELFGAALDRARKRQSDAVAAPDGPTGAADSE